MANSPTKQKLEVTNVVLDPKSAEPKKPEAQLEAELDRSFPLNKPFVKPDGTVLESLSLEFRNLTGDDIEQLEQEYFKLYAKANPNYVAPVMDKRFVKLAIAKVNGIMFPLLSSQLDAEDYIGLTQKGFAFLGSKA